MSGSILDTDLYKLSMQNAIRTLYPEAQAAYRFTNRSPEMRFNDAAFDFIKTSIRALDDIRLSREEKTWLRKTCPYFPADYLDWLAELRLDSRNEVHLKLVKEAEGDEDGYLEIDIEGRWCCVILYEVPILAILSEAYFRHVDTSWDYAGQHALAKDKGIKLLHEGIAFSEFGTRRRRSYNAHKNVVQALVDARNALTGDGTLRGKLTGTSNVHLAMLYGLNPVGTIAHEWIMGIAALEGYEGANALALRQWEKVYPDGALRVALTDTFSTKPFFNDLKANPDLAKNWNGLRQDSGDPFEFINVAIKLYRELGIDPATKNIVFSDGLHIDKAIDLSRASKKAGINCSMGVGTFFTNDFAKKAEPVDGHLDGEGPLPPQDAEKSKPLNIVIKLYKINGIPCVKISDEMNKTTGDQEAVKMVKERFGL